MLTVNIQGETKQSIKITEYAAQDWNTSTSAAIHSLDSASKYYASMAEFQL